MKPRGRFIFVAVSSGISFISRSRHVSVDPGKPVIANYGLENLRFINLLDGDYYLQVTYILNLKLMKQTPWWETHRRCCVEFENI